MTAVQDVCRTYMVVSVMRALSCFLMAWAQPWGPCLASTSIQPVGVALPMPGKCGGGGVMLEGGLPTAPGWEGPFTTCSGAHVACLILTGCSSWSARAAGADTCCAKCCWPTHPRDTHLQGGTVTRFRAWHTYYRHTVLHMRGMSAG